MRLIYWIFFFLFTILIHVNVLSQNSDTVSPSKTNSEKRIKYLLSKYKEGVTEETLSLFGSEILQRVVIRCNGAFVYQKKTENFGFVSYYKDDKPISLTQFENETSPLDPYVMVNNLESDLKKDKNLAMLQLKVKEEEIKRNKILNEVKRKEISSLNKEKTINELTIKNKEAELLKKAIEEQNSLKRIESLNKEKLLSEKNLKQQKSIRNLIGLSLALLFVFSIFIFKSLRKSKKSNKIISYQKQEVEKQKHLVDEKNKDILDSITYAKRLQEAILPPQEFIKKYIPSNFILYKPKDLVAGDFYWAEKINDLFFIAAADSTGHGVPGAMVSVVCSNALNRTVKEFNLTETGKILDKTRELVLETFEKSTSEVKDGMDISLLCIDSKNKEIFWSGANNALWYVHNNELIEIKADKQSIGKTEYPRPFTTHQIEYKSNTTYYLFTDGFADQFGGPKGKKFKYKQFSDLLVNSVNLIPQQQAEIVNKAFEDWKGNLEQVDDVCVIGIKI